MTEPLDLTDAELQAAYEREILGLALTDAELVETTADLLERWAEDHPQTRVVLYRPETWAVVGDTFAASRDVIQRRIEHGRWMVENAQELHP